MRLRKHCGDSQTDPELCTMPILNAYSIEDGIPASLLREQNLHTSITSHDAFGALRTLEWFEENPYTRKNEVPGWNCGCEQGEELWTTLIKQTYTWWVEISNPFLSSSYNIKAKRHLSTLSSPLKLFIPNKNSRISIVPSASPSERNELNVVNDIEKK